MNYGPVPELINICRQAAAEACVLLENRNNLLPLTGSDKVALFGRIALNYYRTGTGSGGNVKVSYETNVLDGLKAYPHIKIDEELLDIYKKWIEKNPFDNGNGMWASEPLHQAEMPVDDSVAARSARTCNKALIFIGRTSGEDKDNLDEPGSYRLTSEEKQMIQTVCKHFEHVGVIYNVSNVMDMSWMTESFTYGHIESALICWQGGQEGGNALADVLVGKVNPSGCLPDTVSKSLSSNPADKNHADPIFDLFEEDIYVGYRYYETFKKDQVLYPFGHGLSYTSFEYSDLRMEDYSYDNLKAKARLTVTNTGAVAGAHVVQLYLSPACGLLGRPSVELMGFTKTKVLAPGEKADVTIDADISLFGAYDDGGITGRKSCYVLEAGEYRVFAGKSARDLYEVTNNGVAAFSFDKLEVLETAHEAMAPVRDFMRLKAKATDDGYEMAYEKVPTSTVDLADRINKAIPVELPKPNRRIHMNEVTDGTATVEEFVGQLTQSQLACLARGEGMSNSKVTPGTAAIFGGVSDELMRLGVPAVCCSDGPSGLNMEKSLKATQLPVATALAATFNSQLIYKLYKYLAKEMRYYKVDILLGPGINIHRHPLCGRNFEYYSEDPFLTGVMACAISKGFTEEGVAGAFKHACANSQEKARHTVDEVVSERALREIYLKAFKMAVKIGKIKSIMTSYNKVNGHYTSSNYDLATVIMRDEWGFDGMVMTDWWSRTNNVELGGEKSFTDFRSMVRSQNDVYMVVNNNAAFTNAKGDNIEESVVDGSLTIAELQRNAVNIIRLASSLPCAEREVVVPSAVTFAPSGEKSKKDIAIKDKECYSISDETVVKNVLNIEIEEKGTYMINIGVSSTDWELAQVLSTLFINETRAGDIQTNGTGGKVRELYIVKAALDEGIYSLRVEHVRPRLDLHYLKLIKVEE